MMFYFVYVPSEAQSEIVAYLPTEKVLLSAEVIQDHSFPNIYSLRGGKFRDPSTWSYAIDTFLNLFPEAEHMFLQHGPPIINNVANVTPNDPTSFLISDVLTRYRDAIQLVRDQTLRWAMKGYSKEEITHLVHLPTDQRDYKPWLREFYGTVKHSIPAVYTGYIGWFDGDPVALRPVTHKKLSTAIVKQMGGDLAVLNLAKDMYDLGNKLSTGTNPGDIEAARQEWQCAAELVTYPFM
jgi:alkyl sulfatase BDS1-like metallo-beta-lactamase superfamily hydrolase